MKQKLNATVLDDDVFPIVGWAGLSGDMITPETMRDMRKAGFTVNHGNLKGRDPVEVLDIAHAAGMRMIVCADVLHVDDGLVVTDERRQAIESLVRRIQDHPGLYMYHLRDEPRWKTLEPLAEVAKIVRTLDRHHPCYVNHNPPIGGREAATAEELIRKACELMPPDFLSYDHYVMCVASQDELRAEAGAPWMLPEAHLRIKPDFYQCLQCFRTLSQVYRVPFWAFTNAVRHGSYPPPTEAQIRFQLMSALAYGARGLQYFTYAYDSAMVRPDGSTTETWEMARRVNADIHAMAPLLRTLEPIGVYHSGPLWPMTERPPADLLKIEGDPALVGVFRGADGLLYLLVVSKNPCAWSMLNLKPFRPEPIFEFDVRDGSWARPYPRRPENQPLTLAPGEGRLLRLGGEGQSRF